MLTDVAPLEMKGSNLVTLKRLHPLNAGFNSLFVFGYDFVLCVFVFMYYFCSFCCHFWEVSYVSIMSREHESGAKRSLSSPPFMPTSKSNSFDLTWSLSALLADTQKQNKNKSKNKNKNKTKNKNKKKTKKEKRKEKKRKKKRKNEEKKVSFGPVYKESCVRVILLRSERGRLSFVSFSSSSLATIGPWFSDFVAGFTLTPSTVMLLPFYSSLLHVSPCPNWKHISDVISGPRWIHSIASFCLNAYVGSSINLAMIKYTLKLH